MFRIHHRGKKKGNTERTVKGKNFVYLSSSKPDFSAASTALPALKFWGQNGEGYLSTVGMGYFQGWGVGGLVFLAE